jgi:hypothetical protein
MSRRRIEASHKHERAAAEAWSRENCRLKMALKNAQGW